MYLYGVYVICEYMVMLIAILNPRPLLSMGPPGSYSHNSAEEAYLALENIISVWSASKLAIELTKQKCGSNLTFSASYMRF